MVRKSVLVTRPADQGIELCKNIVNMGWECTLFPTLEVVKASESGSLSAVVKNFNTYDIALFVSANAVTYGLRWFKKNHLSWPQNLLIGAVGKSTATSLVVHGQLHVDLIPDQRFDSEGLLALNDLQYVKNKNIVIFRGSGGREYLAETLKKRGASVTYAEVYQRRMPTQKIASMLSEEQRNRINIAVSTSNEGLENLYIMTEEVLRPWLLNLRLVVLSSRAVVVAEQLGFKHKPLIAAPVGNTAIIETLKKVFL